jgi:hypothetical protein
MDELFLIPKTPVAMPRAYWLSDHFLSSQLVLIQPSSMEFQRIMDAIATSPPNDYDMEIVNNLYGMSGIILPHRPYNLLTAEFKRDPGEHEKYLGNNLEVWDPNAVLKEAKFLHFSDWPMPKPWIDAGQEITDERKPKCHMNVTSGLEDDCRDQELWLGFYADFKRRRKV